MSSPTPPAATSFSLNVIRIFTAQGLTRAMLAVTSVVTARWLGPHDRGLYSLLLMLPQTLEVLLRLGVAQANVYMICRERRSPSHILSNSIVLALGLGAAAFLVLPFRDVLTHTLFPAVDGWYLVLAVALVPVYLLATSLTSILHALNQFQAANRQAIVEAGARLVAIFVVLVLLHGGLVEAFAVSAAVVALATAWLLGIVWRATSGAFRPSLQVAASTVRFGLKSHLHTVLSMLHLRLDYFLIAYFLGPSDVAFYAIATYIAELISSIYRPVSIALYPLLASSTEARIHETTITVCRHALLLEALAGVVIVAAARPVIGLVYGPDYLPAVLPLFIIIPGVLMLSLFNLLSRNFMSRNQQQITIVAGLVGLAANIALNVLLLPRLGISGAALSSTLSYSLAAGILLVSFRRDSGVSLLELVTVRRRDLLVYRRLVARLVARPATV